MPDTKNVTTGKAAVGGAVHIAPVGSTLPTSASATLDAAFEDLGYVSDEGLTNALDRSADLTRAWGGDVVNVEQTEPTDAFSFTLIESVKEAVLDFIHGSANVTVTGTATTVTVNNDAPVSHAFVFDMILKGGVAKRIVIPEAYLTELGDIVYVDNDVTGFECTITCMADASGNTHYEYIA